MAERDPGEIFENTRQFRERFRDDFEFAVAPLRAEHAPITKVRSSLLTAASEPCSVSTAAA